MTKEHYFHKDELITILDDCLGKTLEEVDSKNIFENEEKRPKNKGIAGNIIEQSVLGYPADTRQEPDLNIDGVKTELKTTGLKYNKNKKKLEAKEPMSITAVSPAKIVKEEFENSKFWHKLEHLLFIYYLYDSETTVKTTEYKNFPIKGYQFYEFNTNDQSILKKDWETVMNFIKELQNNYDNYEEEYPRISHELRSQLMYIDTAPKWPNNPRFRLKRKVLSSIIEDHFGEKLEQLPGKYSSYSDIYDACHKLSEKYRGKSIDELIDLLDIDAKSIHKSIGEHIIVRMFGGKSKKMQKIDLFNKTGIVGKTLTLTEKGLRKEDMKLFPIDFDEIKDENVEFEDSETYDYFANNRFLCIIFQKPYAEAELNENEFQGFKIITFDEEFIQTEVRTTWQRTRDLILNDELEDIIIKDRNGNPRKNRRGNIMSAPNFPKSSEGNIFVRGTSTTSDNKPLNINGIDMYKQYMWVKGTYIVEKINNEDYI